MMHKPEHCPSCESYPNVGIAVGARMQHAEWRVWCDCGAVRSAERTKTKAIKAYNRACAIWRKEAAKSAKRGRRGK